MIPWFQYTVVHLGPIPIQVWGFFVALGMATALWILHRRARVAGLNPDKILDAALTVIILGLVGARIFHVVFYEPAYYLAQPFEILKVWRGGMSSIGGFVGAALGFFLAIKKNKIARSDMWRAADLMSYAALFGWMIGRLGCVMIHDHLGAHSTCPFAIQTPDGPRLEMSILEITGLIPLAVLFFVTRKKKLAAGWYVAVMSLYYGFLRFVLDFYRATDIPGADARYLGLTPAQYFSMVMAVWGGYALYKIRLKRLI